MRKFSSLAFILFIAISASAQQLNLSGTISNASSGDNLSGAHITVYKLPEYEILNQAISASDGSYNIAVAVNSEISFHISHIGFSSFEKKMKFSADSELIQNFQLMPLPVPFGEVTVSTLRRERILRNVSMPVAIMSSSKIEKIPAITMSDAISQEAGVSLVRDGIWATSLNIRGLGENRIITLIDGNRVETSTDIAAGLSMIDLNDIDRIEVIKGAASSLYGTGALGGVVNIITKSADYNDKFYLNATLSGLWNNVNTMHSEHLAVNAGDEKWFARVSGSYRDANNTMTPAGELPNSQFLDNNISAKIGLKPADDHQIKINYQRFTARDVGIPGGKAFPASASASYPIELRELFSAGYEMNTQKKYLDNLKINYFRQYILRDVLLQPNANVAITPTGYHTTNGIMLQSDWKFTNNNLIAGIDVWQRHLRTERERNIRQPILDGEGNISGYNLITVGEIPIPQSWYRSAGLFLQDEFSGLNNRLKINVGGRVDLINVKNDEVYDPIYRINNGVLNNTPPGQRLTFTEGNENGISWSSDLGFLFNPSKNTDLTFTVSKAFRSPSLDERFKYIDLGASVRLGNPELKPEHGYFFDLGGRIWLDNFQFSANIFLNKMTDLIIEIPGEAEFPLVSNPDSLIKMNALINTNVDESLLYGLDISTTYNFYDNLVLYASAAMVIAKDILNDSDLPLIPPFNAQTGLRHTFSSWFGVDISAKLVNNQEKIAEGETISKGYSKYDLSIYSFPIAVSFANISFFAGIENITNRAYVNHLASNRGFIKYEPGRNIYVKVKVEF
jgi:hemoglobin/transferrin/lactoferrin receptor protein